jgi:N utilization substance protein B
MGNRITILASRVRGKSNAALYRHASKMQSRAGTRQTSQVGRTGGKKPPGEGHAPSRRHFPKMTRMTRRSRAREVALQLLFWRDVNPTAPRPAIERFVRERLHDAAHEPYCLALFDGVTEQSAALDEQLAAAAENWRVSRMAVVDRNVLRLGAYELLHNTETPPAVAINEAIELARRYGSKDSAAFVNGILDRINQLRTGAPPAVEVSGEMTND